MRIAFVAIALAACEPADERGHHERPPVLLQHLAGVRGEDGWTVAVSTRGRFRVELPGLYDEIEIIDGAPPPASVHILRARSAALSFHAQCHWRTDPIDLSGVAPSLPGAIAVRGTLPGFQWDERRARGWRRSRSFEERGRGCLVDLETLDGSPIPAQIATRFFESFRID